MRGPLATLITIAASADPRVAVMEIRPQEGIGPEVAEPLELLTAARLATTKYSVMGPHEVRERLAKRPDLRGCSHGACLDSVATFLSVAKLLGGTIRREEEGLAADLWMFDAVTRASVAATARCQGCDTSSAPRVVESVLQEVVRRDAERHLPSSLDVRSTPPGATVYVDGQPAGATPITLRVPAGAHTVRVEHPGLAAQTRDASPQPGQAVQLRFDLTAVAPAAVAAAQIEIKKPSPWKWTAWASGIAALGAGIAILAIDGQEIARTEDQTREVRETTAEGATLIGMGVALGITGGILWWKE